MKKMQRELKTYQNYYVSVDGKEFDTEKDCLEWEKSYKGTLQASFDLLKKIKVSDAELGIPWSCEDHTCYVLIPNTLEDITLINAYCYAFTGAGHVLLTADAIGKTVALDFGYDADWCDAYILDNHIKKLMDYIAELTEELKGESK